MKKETINTFDKGMIRDLHPLTTPNNVLTDALNATLITYNGNENILQNDMGNTLVGTAFLPAGYVPVGMKEYGGIIYVAAYNPETGKGLIGSFPSPLQLWKSENWSVSAQDNIITRVTEDTNFYDGDFIVKESCKIQLFRTNKGPTIFHPGDKFIIEYNKSAISNYVNKGYLSVLLGVVKQDGSIEIMRTWSKESNNSDFLYEGSGNDDLTAMFSDSLKKMYILVFDASSSGYLILIFNLHTLDSFNLTRTYSEVEERDNQNNIIKKILVTLKGEGYKDGIYYTSLDAIIEEHPNTNYYLGLCKGTEDLNNTVTINSSDLEKEKIIVEGQSDSTSFLVYPCVPFGIIERMKRRISINFDKIKKSDDDFSEWRFYVTEKYVKIGWAYDFYNLDHTKEIEYIRMYFHKLEDGYNRDKASYVTFQKENYNGNFEDYINYSDAGLLYKNIYIVEIVKKFKNSENVNIIDFKMLYLSKLYNNKYNEFYKNNAIGETTDNSSQISGYQRGSAGIMKIKLKCNLESELTLSKALLLKPGDSNLSDEIDISDISSNDYATLTSLLDTNNLSSYQYLTRIKNTYVNNLSVTAEVDYDSDLYIGSPNTNLIKTAIASNVSLNVSDSKAWINDTNSEFSPTSSYEPEDNFSPSSKNINDNLICTYSPFSITSYSLIQGKVSDILSTSYESVGLKPLYSPNYTADRKNKIAPYWSQDNARCIAGAGEKENGIYYNSSLRKDGGIIEGPNSGGGFDDGGLSTASNYMGNPMTNIFSGLYGEEGEITFDYLRENRNEYHPGADDKFNFISGRTENKGDIISYQNDNFLIACWKFTDGNTHLVNLATSRYPNGDSPSKEDYVKSTCAWPRLDVILRCLLSLIFVATRTTNSVEFITASNKFYRYLEGDTTLGISTSNNSNLTDALLIDGKTPLEWLELKWKYEGDEIEIDRVKYPFLNLIPDVNAQIENLNENILLPKYNIDPIMSLYLNAGFRYVSSNNLSYDPKVMYKLDTNLTALNISACAKVVNGQMRANIDGAYEWKDTPACIPITDSLSIYRWNDSTQIIEFPGFNSTFKTKGAIEEWTTVPEGEENEVYAIDNGYRTSGNWTNADDENAPDMYYKILYSPQISVLKNELTYV